MPSQQHHGIDYDHLFRPAVYPWGDDWRGHHRWSEQGPEWEDAEDPTTVDELDAQLEQIRDAA